MSAIVNRTKNKNLKFVDNLADYKVHHDDTDIRNFKVKSSTGDVVGEVEGLLADIPSKLVRYAEIEVDDDIINRYQGNHFTEEDRHILVPIGLVHINKSDRSVTINGLGIDHFIDYPRYNRNNGYTTSYEIDTNDYLAGFHEYGSTYDRNTYSNDRYRNSDSLDTNFYGSNFYTKR